MIGVLSRPDQGRYVEELFEFFKTPWEPYTSGRAYDVVLVTTDEVPDVQARLLLVMGSTQKIDESRDGCEIAGGQVHGTLSGSVPSLPIYGSMATFSSNGRGTPVLWNEDGAIAAIRDFSHGRQTIRIGYDLLDELRFLISDGQPSQNAHIPTIDLHIDQMKSWMIDAGISFLEILPKPSGHAFMVCLTHDIDFIGLRYHKLDHTMWGFIYRSTFGSVRDFVRRRISLVRVLQMWSAVAAMPFIYLGWVRDFWEPFEWYAHVEENLGATYFLIPFKQRTGDGVPGLYAYRRATKYDVEDLRSTAPILARAGCEVAVHGIDAWHSVEKGREELARVRTSTGQDCDGIRMHWLLQGAKTPAILEAAGYAYDASAGYNDAVGYRNGTGQVFRPNGATWLLELPLHIQDGALFFREQMDLSESEADARCDALIRNAEQFGGALTVLWHDRSHGPERFWGHFYVRLVERLKACGCWFGTAAQVVRWFRSRREVRFERIASESGLQTVLRGTGKEVVPPLAVRIHNADLTGGGTHLSTRAERFVDISWDGKSALSSDMLNRAADFHYAVQSPAIKNSPLNQSA